ncbi:TIGR04104 family putative zinc finger protein [Psychrobacillus psychrodurans]|uniref:TIGR04104 family putative zinc finger protein n=1 Tax=Psychrobacillus psychrodurans TaxID=126157 RepID=UPI0008EB4EA8|nr:cxxc_20_cxxc protein [Psychrobacillus psychrodurans]
MQKCGKCNEHFSWSKIYESFWLNYKPIKCNECNTTHKITMPSTLIFVSFTILPMLTFGFFLSPFSNGLVTLGIATLIFIIGSLLAPFLVTYKES